MGYKTMVNDKWLTPKCECFNVLNHTRFLVGLTWGYMLWYFSNQPTKRVQVMASSWRTHKHHWKRFHSYNQISIVLHKIAITHCALALELPQAWLAIDLGRSSATDNIQNISNDPPTNFCGWPSLLSIPGQPSFSWVLISQIAPKGSVAHLCWPRSAVSRHSLKLPSQNKEAIMPINIRPVIIKNIVWFSGLALS